MKAITGTLNTLTDTFTIVSRYRPYGVYPLLSFVAMLLVTFVAFVPLFESVLGPDPKNVLGWILFGLAVYLAYGMLYLIIAFGNVMLVMGIAARLEGVAPASTGELFTRMVRRLSLIVVYTVVSATLGLLSILARVLIGPLFGGLIAPRLSDKLWMRWHQLSYKIPLQLAVPIIALDQPPPKNMFARSELLVKTTWGERVKPAHGMGLLTLLALLLVMLYAIPTLQQGLVEDNADLRRLGLRVTLIVIGTYTQFSALANGIFALAAYRYATARKSDLFPGDPSYAEAAFVQSKKAGVQETAPTTTLVDVPSIMADDSSH